MNKKKVTFYALVIILLISLIGNMKLLYDNMRYGDAKEREEVLVATMFELEKQGYKEKDIKEIETQHDYFLLKGKGEYPYRYIVYVVTKDDPTEVKTFTWADKKKTKVKIDK